MAGIEKKYRMISCFAGCGGSSRGYNDAGYNEILAIDNEENCEKIFALNFPDVKFLKTDISKLSGETVLDLVNMKRGELDLLDGSPPCQGFSLAGNKPKDKKIKNIANDSRNELFFHYIRLINEIYPKVFVIENVPGMLYGKIKGKFIQIIKQLRLMDYNIKIWRINSIDYEVPQKRSRLIFIGIRKDLNIEPSLPEPIKKRITVGEALQNCDDHSPVEKMNQFMTNVWMNSGFGFFSGVWGFQNCKLNPNKPAPTISRVKMCRFFRWDECRELSVQEYARLSSFPDSFTWLSSKQVRCIGR